MFLPFFMPTNYIVSDVLSLFSTKTNIRKARLKKQTIFSNRNEPKAWSPLRKRAGNEDDGGFNPPPPDPKRPALSTPAAANKTTNPLASVVGAITAPPPPPPPPPPEEESMFGRYQPPPPPPDESAYYRGGPPQQQGYGNPGLMGQYPGQSQMPPGGGNYGNFDGGYSGGSYPGQGYAGNQGGPGGYQSRGGGPPSLMDMAPYSNTNPRSLSYQGNKPPVPINPLYANQQQQQGGYGGYGAGGYGAGSYGGNY